MLLRLVAARVEGHLGAAAEALDRGDAAAAGRTLALVGIYVDSHLWDGAWSPSERTAARGKERALAQRLVALRTIEERVPLLAAARRALLEARSTKRPTAAGFARARDAAAACGAPLPHGADTAWKGRAGSLDDLLAECGQIARDANAGEARAAADAGTRDQAYRAVLRGDRLLIYERYGAPSEPDGPEGAHAPVWVYVEGPIGPLRQVTRLILTFRGDKLVGRRRTRHAR